MDSSIDAANDTGRSKHGQGRRIGSMKIADVCSAFIKMKLRQSVGSKNHIVFTTIDNREMRLPLTHKTEISRNYIKNLLRHGGITEEEFLRHV